MTELRVATGRTIPAWTRSDRLRKARESADLSKEELADLIGVSRNTVGNYEGEKVDPRKAVLIAWALATNVDYEWIVGDPNPNDTGVTRPQCPWIYDSSVTLGTWETPATPLRIAS